MASLLMSSVEVIGVLDEEVVRPDSLGAVTTLMVMSLIYITTLMLMSLVYEVQVNEELCDVNTSKYHLCVAHNVLSIRVTANFKLQTSTVVVRTEGPEVSLMHSLHSLQLHHLLVGLRQALVQLPGGPLHQHRHTVRHQGSNRQAYQNCDEDGADGVGDHPSEQLHQDGRHYNSN